MLFFSAVYALFSKKWLSLRVALCVICAFEWLGGDFGSFGK